MGIFYFDESKHAKDNFLIGAYVFSEKDVNENVESILLECGYDPSSDEFKSHALKDGDIKAQNLRNKLYGVLRGCKVGLLIAPHTKYQSFFHLDLLHCLINILNRNNLTAPHKVYLDQGIFTKNNKIIEAKSLLESLKSNFGCTIHLEQDSKNIRGIQLADLAAHYCSTKLKEELGSLKKNVSPRAIGYPTNEEINIGFEMFIRMRWLFFIGNYIDDEILKGLYENSGLWITDRCNDKLAQAAKAAFNQVYLGCTL